MKKSKIIILGIFILISFILPLMAISACSKPDEGENGETLSNNAAGEENADKTPANDEKNDDANDDIPEAAAEPQPVPGADVPEGGLLKAYNFADGLQGIESCDDNDDDSIEIVDISGVKALAVGHKFGGGWEMAMFKFPDADVPLLAQASTVKYDVYVPVDDINKVSYTSFLPARRTDWGKWWESWSMEKSDIQASETVGDYYKFTHEFPLEIESDGNMYHPISSEWEYDTWELSIGVVFNGFESFGDLPVCFANIEFIK
ncbi:MAG: hypothetical protein FWF92_01650 [Oscillospiraceae bacterium]|nr:hypothetical protein [Oscillospiraceae bacterium]